MKPADATVRCGHRCLVRLSATVVALAVGWASVVGFADALDEDAPSKKPAASTAKPNESAPKPPKSPEPVENPFPNRFPAPSLDGGTAWLNTSGEITLKDLRGKVVLLDFWTYCCINCMHVLPDLKFLEQKYAQQVVVIGVHSAKFDNEKESENIRRAILRYEIEHPVINDSEMTVWRKMGASAWPTLVLIDPEGFYCGYVSGEGNRELLDAVLAKLIDYHRSKGTLDESPVRFDLDRNKLKPTPLKFPGKVLADAKSNRLFVSDSNHNRIVIADLDGKLLDIVGSGAIGAADGPYGQAAFDHPQGMALVGETLYVADTENHLLRTVDLRAKTVSTLAGTGEQARFRATGGRLRETALNSPWDLVEVDGTLYVAMAGPHQIWAYQLGADTIRVFAGSGREDILNGSLEASAFAQPSAVVSDGKSLFVADSEGSAIRQVPLQPKAEVSTVVGTSELPSGRSLFEFGDVDGEGSRARLQHPLGLALNGGTLYVADTYNHKIKRIDLKQRTINAWLGNGKPGEGIDPPQFSEPGGLSFAAGKLYAADTNNHRVCVILAADREATVLTIDGLAAPNVPAEVAQAAVDPVVKRLELPPQTVRVGDVLNFEVTLGIPAGFKLNSMAPVRFQLAAVGEQNLISAAQLDSKRNVTVNDATATAAIPLENSTGEGVFEVALSYTYCRDGVGGLCKLKSARWLVPVKLVAEATQTVVKLQVETSQ